jgi:hypothetical protein
MLKENSTIHNFKPLSPLSKINPLTFPEYK